MLTRDLLIPLVKGTADEDRRKPLLYTEVIGLDK